MTLDVQRLFKITGNLGRSLYPGGGAPLNLRLTNPNDFPVTVTRIAAQVAGTDQTGCGTENFRAGGMQLGVYPFTLEPGESRTLQELGLSNLQEPRIRMLDTALNQDALPMRDPFATGAMVIVTLAAPREKFWGAIRAITAAGVIASGIDLNSFDDFLRTLRDNQKPTATTVFFPMHRVERIELDLPESNILSLSQRFAQQTSQDPAPLLTGEFIAGDQQ